MFSPKSPLELETLCLGPLDVNCYIAGCSIHKVCAVFDPADSAHVILARISEKGWKVAHIINTHGHADHTGANLKMKEATAAPISIHQKDNFLLTHEDMAGMAGYLGLQASPEPDRLLNDGDSLEVCPCLAFTVIHTPGHSPGGACFYHDGFAIVGDTIFRMSIGRSDLPGGDFETLLKSIRERLFTLPDATALFPGHGDPTDVGFEKKSNPFLMGAFFR